MHGGCAGIVGCAAGEGACHPPEGTELRWLGSKCLCLGCWEKPVPPWMSPYKIIRSTTQINPNQPRSPAKILPSTVGLFHQSRFASPFAWACRSLNLSAEANCLDDPWGLSHPKCSKPGSLGSPGNPPKVGKSHAAAGFFWGVELLSECRCLHLGRWFIMVNQRKTFNFKETNLP